MVTDLKKAAFAASGACEQSQKSRIYVSFWSFAGDSDQKLRNETGNLGLKMILR